MLRNSALFIIFLSIVDAFKFVINGVNNRISSAKTSNNEEPPHQQSADRHCARNRCKRLRLKEAESAMRGFEALTDSFLGGTVGVMSVAFLLEVRKVADERLDGCPYCMGNGEILCASCYGTGDCKFCYGRGLVKCINCKGDGRITPILLQSKAVRDPDYATDDVGSGINGA